MKAILVIDIPKKCYECPLMSNDMYCKAYANIVKGRKLCVEDDVLHGERNSGCPLKPMPEKMKVKYERIATCEVTEKVVAIGWNACVEVILGGE